MRFCGHILNSCRCVVMANQLLCLLKWLSTKFGVSVVASYVCLFVSRFNPMIRNNTS